MKQPPSTLLTTLTAFLRNNAPYMLVGLFVAAALIIFQRMLLMALIEHTSLYGTESLNSLSLTVLVYGTRLLCLAVVTGLAVWLLRTGKIKRPLAHAVLGTGIFAMCAALPWLGWGWLLFALLPFLVILALGAGAASFVAARYALRKIKTDTVACVIGVVLLIVAQIIPHVLISMMFSGWDTLD